MNTISYVNNRMGRVRKEVLNGRQYLVAPFVSLVPGVLAGSKGALFYSASEISKNPGVWNNTPLTLGHPSDPITNLPQSARDPEVLNRVQLGNVFNDHITNDGRRVGEAWFDVQMTREKAPDILNKLEQAAAGRKASSVEISTGLYTENIVARNGASHNGRSYTHIATEMKPDHLAILENQKGACSNDDGCGVILNSNPDGCNQHTGPGCSGGESGSGKGGSKTHDVKLPANRRKLTIDQADTALKQMGYSRGKVRFDLKTKTTVSDLTHSDGSKSTVTGEQLKELVYRGMKPKESPSAPASSQVPDVDVKGVIDKARESGHADIKARLDDRMAKIHADSAARKAAIDAKYAARKAKLEGKLTGNSEIDEEFNAALNASVPTDLTDVQPCVDALQSVLTSALTLYGMTKNFHWNVDGPHFPEYHELFDEQAAEVLGITDAVAERIRKIGGTPSAESNEAAVTAESPRQMVEELTAANRSLLRSLRDAHEACDEAGDVGSVNLIETWIDEAEKRVWFLSQTAAGGTNNAAPNQKQHLESGQFLTVAGVSDKQLQAAAKKGWGHEAGKVFPLHAEEESKDKTEDEVEPLTNATVESWLAEVNPTEYGSRKGDSEDPDDDGYTNDPVGQGDRDSETWKKEERGSHTVGELYSSPKPKTTDATMKSLAGGTGSGGVDPVKNSNPEGINQYTKGGGSGRTKGDVVSSSSPSGKAFNLTHQQGSGSSQRAKDLAKKAYDAEAKGDHETAADLHVEAAKEHRRTSNSSEQSRAAKVHEDAARESRSRTSTQNECSGAQSGKSNVSKGAPNGTAKGALDRAMEANSDDEDEDDMTDNRAPRTDPISGFVGGVKELTGGQTITSVPSAPKSVSETSTSAPPPPTGNDDECSCGEDPCTCKPTDNGVAITGTGQEGSPLGVALTQPEKEEAATANSLLKILNSSSGPSTPARTTKSKGSNSNRKVPMALTPVQRQQAVGYLTVNCDCWKGKDKLLANKETFSDDILVGLVKNEIDKKKAELVANSARKGVKIAGVGTLTFNAEGKPAFLDPKGSSEEAEGSNTGVSQSGGAAAKVDDDEGETDSSLEPSMDVGDKVADPPENTTVNAWLDRTKAPRAVREAILPSLTKNAQEKNRIIQLLVSNCRDPQVKARLIRNHRAKTLQQLKDEASALPPYMQPLVNASQAPRQERPTPQAPNYGPDLSWLNNGPIQNAGGDGPDLLPLPTMNWSGND